MCFKKLLTTKWFINWNSSKSLYRFVVILRHLIFTTLRGTTKIPDSKYHHNVLHNYLQFCLISLVTIVNDDKPRAIIWLEKKTIPNKILNRLHKRRSRKILTSQYWHSMQDVYFWTASLNDSLNRYEIFILYKQTRRKLFVLLAFRYNFISTSQFPHILLFPLFSNKNVLICATSCIAVFRTAKPDSFA
jgi:hypothetical protein